MPDRPPWQPVAPLPRDLVRPVRIDPTGRAGPTPGQARGPHWRRTSHGLYVPAHVDGSHPAQRVVEAATQLPTRGVVTGWARLCLAGAAYFDGLERDGRTQLPVALVSGPGQSRRPRDGIRWLQDEIDPEETGRSHGIPCATLTRALLDEMRIRPLRAAVEAMDMAAAARLVSVKRVRACLAVHAGLTGAPVVRAALDLADERSWSPAETRMRLVWVLDARRPRPLTNRPVFSVTGRLLGIADLLDPVAGVAGEYDGAEHARARRRSRDAAKDSALRDHGLETFRITGYDEHRVDDIVERIHAAYERAARPRMPRRWTLTAPPGWDPAPSLDDELELRELVHSTG